MSRYAGALLTRELGAAMRAAFDGGAARFEGSFDLGRTTAVVALDSDGWQHDQRRYPWPPKLKDRTIYYWDGRSFEPIQRYSGALIKLVPTEWGAPTFEIDGIKMLPTAQRSPVVDAQHKVALVAPRDNRVLDTCGGLGYFAACCLEAGAAQVHSFEKNADVLWLRELNPWSPDLLDAEVAGRLTLTHTDVVHAITTLPDRAFDAILHDPPRFGIAGELYSQAFYDQLARVLRPHGRLFHYTGAPNRLTSGRDVPHEVAKRLGTAGFDAKLALDGVLATLRGPRRR